MNITLLKHIREAKIAFQFHNLEALWTDTFEEISKLAQTITRNGNQGRS